MKLKENFDLVSFFENIKKCSGEVIFVSDQGDRLNLKSQLSKYIFIAAKQDSALLAKSTLLLSAKSDVQYLEHFLEF